MQYEVQYTVQTFFVEKLPQLILILYNFKDWEALSTYCKVQRVPKRRA